MTYDDIVSRVAESTGLSKNIVNKIYKAYWKAVRQHIVSLNLKEDLTDEEFLKLRPNINIPSIGKLYVTAERYRKLKNKGEKIKLYKEEYGTTHQENQAS